MFISNKYSKWYYSIVAKAKSQNRVKGSGVYYESHHIIPSSLGGNNKITNKVLLTFKEHFICHHLLTKMCKGDDKMRMCYAFFNMKRGNKKIKRTLSEVQLRLCRDSISEYKHRSVNKNMVVVKDSSGNNLRVSIDDPRYISGELIPISKGMTRTFSEEEKDILYSTRRGRKYSEEETHKRNLNRKEIWNKGKAGLQIHSDDTKLKMSLKKKGISKPTIQCPHCNKIGGLPQMKQWHFDNCKEIIIAHSPNY